MELNKCNPRINDRFHQYNRTLITCKGGSTKLMLDFLNKNRNSEPMKKHLICLGMLFIMAFPAFSQEQAVSFNDKKALGDKVFNLDIGVDVPLFFQSLTGEIKTTNLSIGGILGVSMEGYLNNDFRLGGGFKLNFSSNPNGKFLFALPFFAQGSYELKFYPFRLVSSLEVGAILLSYDVDMALNPFLAPSLGFYYVLDSKWSMGLNTRYWWIPQYYWGKETLVNQSRLANFMEISLGFSYYFY